MEPIAAAPAAPRGADLSATLARRCTAFLAPLLRQLDAQLDVRLVRTLAQTVGLLVRHRNRALALLLTELGSLLCGPAHTPAGVKRLANLLHSTRWRARSIDAYLLARGTATVQAEAARVPEGRALCILDGSVLEKPESTCLDGLAPVRSSKARRLARPRVQLGPGYYHGPPGGPIVVPGFRWVAALVTGWALPTERRPLVLGAWHWYTRPDPAMTTAATPDLPAQTDREAEQTVLTRLTAAWGADALLHVWDRGFSGAPWLSAALDQHLHFVVRWKKGNRLRPATAPSLSDPTASAGRQERDGVEAWRLTAGLRAWGTRQLPDPRRPERPQAVSFAARPVSLLHRPEPLWLVVVRLGRGGRRRGSGEPWRLLTTEPVTDAATCWRIVQAYAARWTIEQMLRYGKSELGIESLRLRDAEARHKLLAIVSLTYAFLIDLLGESTSALLAHTLRCAHRTGRQAHAGWRPLYRLRAALAVLWTDYTPNLQESP